MISALPIGVGILECFAGFKSKRVNNSINPIINEFLWRNAHV